MIEVDVPTGALEIDVQGYGSGVALQVDGNDLVHLTDIGPENGTARLTVFASSHERAAVLWTGTVDLTGHLEGPPTTGALATLPGDRRRPDGPCQPRHGSTAQAAADNRTTSDGSSLPAVGITATVTRHPPAPIRVRHPAHHDVRERHPPWASLPQRTSTPTPSWS